MGRLGPARERVIETFRALLLGRSREGCGRLEMGSRAAAHKAAECDRARDLFIGWERVLDDSEAPAVNALAARGRRDAGGGPHGFDQDLEAVDGVGSKTPLGVIFAAAGSLHMLRAHRVHESRGNEHRHHAATAPEDDVLLRDFDLVIGDVFTVEHLRVHRLHLGGAAFDRRGPILETLEAIISEASLGDHLLLWGEGEPRREAALRLGLDAAGLRAGKAHRLHEVARARARADDVFALFDEGLVMLVAAHDAMLIASHEAGVERVRVAAAECRAGFRDEACILRAEARLVKVLVALGWHEDQSCHQNATKRATKSPKRLSDRILAWKGNRTTSTKRCHRHPPLFTHEHGCIVVSSIMLIGLRTLYS